jgi:hypothetical protein
LAKIGSWSYDLVTGFQNWSAEHYRIFEIPAPQPQDVLNKLYRARIHPEDLPVLDHLIARGPDGGRVRLRLPGLK